MGIINSAFCKEHDMLLDTYDQCGLCPRKQGAQMLCNDTDRCACLNCHDDFHQDFWYHSSYCPSCQNLEDYEIDGYTDMEEIY